MSEMDEIVIVNGARTAFGAFGGGLASKSATDLAVAAAAGAMERSGVKPEVVDSVVMGNVIQTSKDAIYLARHVALRNGLKDTTPGLILNLLCGSGVNAVATAAMQIRSGMASVVLAGGTDALSMTPYLNWSNRWGGRMGHMELWDGLDIRDTYARASMGETAENIREKYNISREAQDEFALRSQTLAAKAMESGRLREEIVGVEVPGKKGNTVIEKDEHARPETTLEGLAKLKPVFRQGGTVTAGNACGIVDGAAALVVTSAKKAEALSLSPMMRVVSWAVAGVPPEIMGIGPVPAIPMALEKAGLKMEQIDLFEINEAFAVQYLACEKELHLPREKVNVNGGAIALGHPFGATGARLLLSIGIELQKRKMRYGCVSLCVGGGMGIAMIVERI
ncbi:MAG: thiolase family protein [Candidatus Obscuribacter phosphatis]|uniref:acetyl-CoA C-acetyltransferase n=1 Tax=Candidatus Obscuribacter phosphatis TaxID=1906157 RepID=A0A8J7P672_9BACT|nr:thiolase family protein [Candidatus Obscuribacter phosphatis]